MNFYYFAPRKSSVAVFCQRVQYWVREYNTANIVLFPTNQVGDILKASNKHSTFSVIFAKPIWIIYELIYHQ